jgi:endonuclease G, mitochondrial
MYFIPGKQDREPGSKKKKNTLKRLLLSGAAVFICITVILFSLRHYFPSPAGLRSDHEKNHFHIDRKLLSDKNFGLPEIRKGDEIIYHFAYVLNYSEHDEEPYWVAYQLTGDHVNGPEKRASHFEADPDVPTGSAEPDDYRRSGYDKGHLAPAADMKWDKQAMRESFYLSNVCPQDHRFNEGIWAELEKAVRHWAKNDSIEYIVTGPVLNHYEFPKIGKEGVSVPSYFYKVIFSPNPYPKAIGFIIPNQPGRQSFWNYACSVSQVEAATRIRFFPKLPANISKELKSTFDTHDWKTGLSF